MKCFEIYCYDYKPFRVYAWDKKEAEAKAYALIEKANADTDIEFIQRVITDIPADTLKRELRKLRGATDDLEGARLIKVQGRIEVLKKMLNVIDNPPNRDPIWLSAYEY